MFFYIADHIEKPSNNDIELLDSIFNIYIRVCGRYGISPTLQMFGILVGINNMTFSDWANGDYRTASNAWHNGEKMERNMWSLCVG